MIKCFYCIVLWVLYMMIPPVFAEQGEPLTLEKSIEMALRSNLAICAAKEEVKRAEFSRKSSFCEFLPELSTTYSYTNSYFELDEDASLSKEGIGNIFMGSNDDYYDYYDFSITMEEAIYTGGALVNSYNRAKIGKDIAEVREDQTKQDIVLKVKEAYFAVLEAEKLKQLDDQAVKRIDSHVRRAREFYNAQMVPKNEVLEAEVQLAQAKQDLIRAGNRLDVAKSLFNTVLRREINKEVELEDILNYKPTAWKLNESTCMHIAYENRPELKELDLVIEDAKREVKFKKSRYHPNIILTGTYLKEGETPSVEGIESWNIKAVAKWTFWKWRKTLYQVQESMTRLARTRYEKEQNKDHVTLEVKESYLNVKEAEKNIAVTEKAIEQAEENFRISEERYKEHVGTSTEVLDAQTLLTQAKTNYYNVLGEYNIARARLVRSMGVVGLE